MTADHYPPATSTEKIWLIANAIGLAFWVMLCSAMWPRAGDDPCDPAPAAAGYLWLIVSPLFLIAFLASIAGLILSFRRRHTQAIRQNKVPVAVFLAWLIAGMLFYSLFYVFVYGAPCRSS